MEKANDIIKDTATKYVQLRSRRSRIHYADRQEIGGTPMLVLNQRNKTDYMTAEEVLSDLYQKEVVEVEVKFKEDCEAG